MCVYKICNSSLARVGGRTYRRVKYVHGPLRSIVTRECFCSHFHPQITKISPLECRTNRQTMGERHLGGLVPNQFSANSCRGKARLQNTIRLVINVPKPNTKPIPGMVDTIKSRLDLIIQYRQERLRSSSRFLHLSRLPLPEVAYGAPELVLRRMPAPNTAGPTIFTDFCVRLRIPLDLR